MYAPVAMFTIPQWEIPITAELPEPRGRMFPRTGFAPYAVWVKTPLRKKINLAKVGLRF